MIDFHSHIIPRIDDGSESEEETEHLLLEAKKAGFNKIISTSHYYVGRYETDEETRKELLKKINQIIKFEEIDLEIYLGSEIYIVPDIIDLLSDLKASTLNMTRYILIELPFIDEVYNLKDILYNLMGKKYKIIIAHPERYKIVQKNPDILAELIELGVLFQSNYGSILGFYGKKAQKTVKKLLKADMVHFLGTDVHEKNSIYPKIPKALKKIEKIVGRRRLRDLTTRNAEMILNDMEFEAYEPKRIKKRR